MHISKKLVWSALTGLVALLVAAGPASAAPANDIFAVSVANESTDLGSFYISGTEPLTSSLFNLTVAAHATWSGSLMTALGWNTNNVRQGSALGVSRTRQRRDTSRSSGRSRER